MVEDAKHTVELLQKSTAHIQQLVAGKGRGLVITLLQEGNKAEWHVTHVRMSAPEAVGHIEILKKNFIDQQFPSKTFKSGT